MCLVRYGHDIACMESLIPFHGANPENLYRVFDISMPDEILDFSTNTNILPWPKIDISIEKLASSYPDPECRELRELIAERENISPSRVLFTNGSNEAIFLLARLFHERVAILQPCYTEYSRAFPNAHNVFRIEEAGNFRAFILTNPNNPTGKYIANLSETIKRFPDTVFIIDEAYIDFVLSDCERERLCDFENVITLRSITKIFHLSGVRIGYVIASEEIISRLKALQPTWSVNSIAQELALSFLHDTSFYEQTRAFYREHTPKFIASIKSAGFEVMDSSVHYFLVRVENDIEVIKFLLRAGIIVRHTQNFPGLDGKYVRISTLNSYENEKLVQTLLMWEKFASFCS